MTPNDCLISAEVVASANARVRPLMQKRVANATQILEACCSKEQNSLYFCISDMTVSEVRAAISLLDSASSSAKRVLGDSNA
jgi:hypothetical protein